MKAYSSFFLSFFFLRTLSIYRSTHHMELDTELLMKYKYHRDHKKIFLKIVKNTKQTHRDGQDGVSSVYRNVVVVVVYCNFSHIFFARSQKLLFSRH